MKCKPKSKRQIVKEWLQEMEKPIDGATKKENAGWLFAIARHPISGEAVTYDRRKKKLLYY